jgi:transposase
MHWTGYKVHLSETCEPDKPNIITHVQTEPAVVPDVRSTPTIHTALKNKRLLPEEHVVDTGYISVDQINTVAQDEVRLIGPSRPNVSWQAKTPGGLSVDQFQIDWERQKAVCPQGKTSVMWLNRMYKSNVNSEERQPMIQVRFSKTDCLACPVRSCCTRSQRGPRELFLAQKAVFEAGRAARA